jgi:hypothetical protein
VAEDLFNRGLWLPSGTAMTVGDLGRVIETILNTRAKPPRRKERRGNALKTEVSGQESVIRGQ